MKILFVTSSTHKMFNYNGKKLLNSFLKYNPNDKLLYCTENFQINNKNIIEYELTQSKYLNDWLEKFKHLIPKSLGGTNNELDNINKKLNWRCSAWNYKASLWFRKIASLEYAHRTFGKEYDTIMWIDSDVEILKHINVKFLNSLFNNKNIFYFLGNKREKINSGIESGFIGFRYEKGLEFLEKVFKIYMSGEFQSIKRWDDGFVFKVLIKKNIEIANDFSDNKHDTMNYNPINTYLIHKKGSHARNQIDF